MPTGLDERGDLRRYEGAGAASDRGSQPGECERGLLTALAPRTAELLPHSEPVPLILPVTPRVGPLDHRQVFLERGTRLVLLTFEEAQQRRSRLNSLLVDFRLDRRHSEAPLLQDSYRTIVGWTDHHLLPPTAADPAGPRRMSTRRARPRKIIAPDVQAPISRVLGGRPAGPPPLPPAEPGQAIEVDRTVKRAGTVSLGQHVVLAAEVVGGRRVGIRIEPATLMFFDLDTRQLLRTPSTSSARSAVTGSVITPPSCQRSSQTSAYRSTRPWPIGQPPWSVRRRIR
ncbi:hypothetical protein [Micromonospora chersina]|uniref:hypothetical protein n=1 Tax=Micromonospora chersina TaxID=47854 RepID=UPI0037158DDA